MLYDDDGIRWQQSKRRSLKRIMGQANVSSGSTESDWNARAMLSFAILPLILSPLLFAQTSTGDQINCANPQFSASSVCRATGTGQQPTSNSETDSNANQRSLDSQQVYVDSAGSEARRRNSSVNQTTDFFSPDPVTDFQRLAHSSTGETLHIFGRDLFERAPSTFAPADQIPVTSDYVVGAGDEILVRLWGPESFNSQLTVDTSGSIYIPKVGSIHVAGLRADELQQQISSEVNHTYRNYRISVNLGRLRSIQVYVVGEARRPGAFTISSLSTVLNALFVSGGPNVQGSLRRIQVRHEGKAPTEFDLYDLVLRGDKSHDVRLQSGDTIFIPSSGPQVAIAGSVRHPAIYELRGETHVSDLLALAGGYTATATEETMSVERIGTDHQRRALTVSMNAEGQMMPLRDGDVLFVNHISQAYQESVTIRGNLANPGRFRWHPGMRLNEIIPDRMSLLTNNYWSERNQLGVPLPLFEPAITSNRLDMRNDNQRIRTGGFTQQNGTSQDDQILRGSAAVLAPQVSQSTTDNTGGHPSIFGQTFNQSSSSSSSPSSSVPVPTNGSFERDASNQNMQDGTRPQNNGTPDRVQNRIQIPAPEIDWSYAVIERLDPKTLKSSLLPFNLGKLVENQAPDQNLELQPGDVVTIISQNDVPVPLAEQTKFIRLEGEFAGAGVYSVAPGESLEDVVRRSGGLTPAAYLYGSSFLRESARIFQQQRLDEYISTLSTDMERSAAVRAASSSSGILDPNALGEQRTLIAQMRQLRASGRVVLEFQPASMGADAIPKIALENGDVFRVPSRPNTVSVVGAVYGQNVFLFNPKRHLDDYVTLAGKPNRIADRKHAFIIRADGSIYSRERAKGAFSNHFDESSINPGDSIVIPEKLIKPTVLRNVLDYSQVLSSFGLAAAAIAVVR
jgi:polysaccharide export outer membrane protein